MEDFPSVEIEKNDLLIQIYFVDNYINNFYSSLVLQSLEIIRKRIDEIGTNEPIIQIQGNQRILVQLPGLKDPERIKSLLGKTAKMNFRMVDERNMNLVNDKKYFVGSEIIQDSDSLMQYVVKKELVLAEII